MSLLDSLDDFVTGTYTVTRQAAATRDVHGRPVAGAVTTFTVDASVQPLTGRELMVLPEAQRSEETQWFYTETQLYTRTPEFEPDVVTINGEPWVVKIVENWNFDGDLFYRCRVVRRAVP